MRPLAPVAFVLLALGGVAAAQAQPRDPYGNIDNDEPTPRDQPPQNPPPMIYVPVPPPIIAPMPYVAPQEPPKKSNGGFVFALDLLGSYRYVLKETWGAGGIHMLIGGETGAIGFGGIVDIELGSSKAGLFYSVLNLGFEFYGRIGERVRLGLGPQFGGFIIVRRTHSDPTEDLSAALVGVNADLSIDLLKSRSTALLIYARIRYDYVDSSSSSYSNGVSGQLGLGVRL
jgi:hypothetical protein